MSRRLIREWRSGSEPHRRTFLQADGRFRKSTDGPEHIGLLTAWAEWEAQARLVAPLGGRPGGARWLCEPVVDGSIPTPTDGSPPQNTDPFVFGERFAYTACRQPTNRKLRTLGRGSLILFGSSVCGEFVLDTVFVVAGYIDHTAATYRDLPDSVASEDLRRFTLDPWYGWGDQGETYRLYVGATSDEPVEGMFSYVPCLPLTDKPTAFARPPVRLPSFVNPRLRMQARSSPAVDAEAVSDAWRAVAETVIGSGLCLGTKLTIPRTTTSQSSAWSVTHTGKPMPDAVTALSRSRSRC